MRGTSLAAVTHRTFVCSFIKPIQPRRTCTSVSGYHNSDSVTNDPMNGPIFLTIRTVFPSDFQWIDGDRRIWISLIHPIVLLSVVRVLMDQILKFGVWFQLFKKLFLTKLCEQSTNKCSNFFLSKLKLSIFSFFFFFIFLCNAILYDGYFKL